MQIENKLYPITVTAIFLLCAALFTSISVSAGFHILILIPGIYFSVKNFSELKQNRSLALFSLIAIIIWSTLSVVFNWQEMGKPLSHIVKLKYFVIGILSIPSFQFFWNKTKELEPEKRDRVIKVLLNTFIIAATLATISGLIGLQTGFNPLKMKKACHVERACGMYGMYMTYGYGISLFMTILLGLIVGYQYVKKYISLKLLYACLLINLVGLILSYARGAYIGFFASVPFFFYKRNIKLFWKITLGLVLTGVLAVAFVPQINKLVFLRTRIVSGLIRVSQYKAAWIAAKENPVFGVGYKNFEQNSNLIKKKHNIEYAYFRGHGHSNFFEHLGSTGFIGLVLLILFHLFWLKEVYVRDDLIGVISFPFVINFFLSGQFQYTFGDGENLFLIMAIFAAMYVRNEQKSMTA